MENLQKSTGKAKNAKRRTFVKTFFYEDGKKFSYKGVKLPADFGDQHLHVNGVLGYLGSYSSIEGSFQKAEQAVEQYSKHVGYAYKGANKMEKRCRMIQKDFQAFRNWCKSNIERTELI